MENYRVLGFYSFHLFLMINHYTATAESNIVDTYEYIISTYIHVHVGVAINEFSHGVIRVGLALALQIIISLFMMYIDHG